MLLFSFCNEFELLLIPSGWTITGKIVQSTIDECKDAYALWINMVFLFFLHFTSLVLLLFHVLNVCLRMYLYSFQAHEFLQEKNLVKQGMAIYFLKFWSVFFHIRLVSIETSYFLKIYNLLLMRQKVVPLLL